MEAAVVVAALPLTPAATVAPEGRERRATSKSSRDNMQTTSAAVSQQGIVIDVETWDTDHPMAPRADGLSRIDAPFWLYPGCLRVDGQWRLPDGSTPSPDQLRREWTALQFDARVESFSPGAWDRLEALRSDTNFPESVRLQVAAAIRAAGKAQTVMSDDPRTIAFVAAAVALGVLTQDAADKILLGP